MDKYVFIGATVFLTVFGQLVVKARATVHAPADAGKIGYVIAMYTDPAVLAALAAALLASVTWALALEKSSLSFAYPFMALNFVLVPFLGAAFFGEPLSWMKLTAIALIVAGVIVNGIS